LARPSGVEVVVVAKHVIRRRELLRFTAAVSGATLLAACLPESKTPNASATPSAGASDRTTAGRFPLGKLEGPVIVTDSAKFPQTFKEAPELAALVQQGKLPPVAQRVGRDPLVIQPVHGIGKYGGTMNKAFTSGINDMSIRRFMTGGASPLLWDYDLKSFKPNIARSFTVSPDDRTITLQLRRGMKWSDGAPFTADDIMFWFDDILNNEDIHPGLSADLSIGGKQITAEKVDETTVRFVAPQAFPLLVEIMATPSLDLGHTNRQELGRGGPYAPKHYLTKFHAKYVGKESADKLAADAKQNGWVANIKARMLYPANPDIPVIYPWLVRVPANDPTSFVIERNPYSIWVDTDGNQLPYIGTVRHMNVPGVDVMALKATSGELDFMELQFTTSQLPVLIQNQDRGNYKVYLDPGQAGVGIALNLAYDEDPVLGELYRTVDFRRALALGIDRDAINETFFLGVGIPSASVPAPENKYYPGDEWAKKWSTLDVAQANQLLDKIGLTQKDAGGYRLRKDGRRLTLTFMAVDRIVDQAQLGETIKGFWQKIGIALEVQTVSTNLAQQRIGANQAQMTINQVGTEDPFLSPGWQTPIGGGFSAIMGVPYAQWINSGGKQGKEPFAEIKQAMELLERGKAGSNADERIRIGKELTQLAVDQVFAIGLVSAELTNGIRIAKNTMGNIPARFANSLLVTSPVTAMPQTYYFKEARA
jgi:peptide/nickel transport system substrate-binding protein